jgi:DHA2 family methylenomycin A resistance protein-like MFS transporter
VIDGYTLLFAALLLFAGNLSDRVGAKKALGLGILVFGLTSAACMAAPDIGALIAARRAQGAAAVVMLPASMALVREAFPDPRRRARALGVWAVGRATAGLVGQPLGGLLSTVDWRWVFTINLPVCAGMLAFLLAVATSPTRPAPFDWPGQILAVTALAPLVYGIIEGGHTGFTHIAVIVALVVAAAAFAGFLLVQVRVRHPMMPLELFHAHGFRLALPVGFAFMVGNYGNVFVVSLFLQQYLGLSPFQTGLAFLPSAFFAIVGNLARPPSRPQVHQLVSRTLHSSVPSCRRSSRSSLSAWGFAHHTGQGLVSQYGSSPFTEYLTRFLRGVRLPRAPPPPAQLHRACTENHLCRHFPVVPAG